MPAVIHDLETLLSQSAATADFKQAVQDLKDNKRQALIVYNSGSPPVKVLRTISKLLEEFPNEVIETVKLDGSSGCTFVWDCKWRAEQEGWTDHFGYPDQIRAAREFGYQCFETFNRT
jgi:hypothetical protein